jgi:hypothetical protein
MGFMLQRPTVVQNPVAPDMRQRSDGATVPLGMPEFVVGARLAVGR